MNQEISAYLIKHVETRCTEFGRRVRTTSQTLQTIAERLRGDASTHTAADFTVRGADVIDRIGNYLENSDFDVLMSDAEDSSRARPWAVASIGIAAGLLASRVLKSTAARRHAFAESELLSTNTGDGIDTADVKVNPGMPSASRATRSRKRAEKVTADGT